MEHHLKLKSPFFEKVANGSKKMELRLFDKKRRLMRLGDTLVFHENDYPEKIILKKVAGLVRFPDFESLIQVMPLSLFDSLTKEALLSDVNQFYSLEDQKENGVLGILLENI